MQKNMFKEGNKGKKNARNQCQAEQINPSHILGAMI